MLRKSSQHVIIKIIYFWKHFVISDVKTEPLTYTWPTDPEKKIDFFVSAFSPSPSPPPGQDHRDTVYHCDPRLWNRKWFPIVRVTGPIKIITVHVAFTRGSLFFFLSKIKIIIHSDRTPLPRIVEFAYKTRWFKPNVSGPWALFESFCFSCNLRVYNDIKFFVKNQRIV